MLTNEGRRLLSEIYLILVNPYLTLILILIINVGFYSASIDAIGFGAGGRCTACFHHVPICGGSCKPDCQSGHARRTGRRSQEKPRAG